MKKKVPAELRDLKVTVEVLKKSVLRRLIGGQAPPCTNDATYGGTNIGNVQGSDACACACACPPKA